MPEIAPASAKLAALERAGYCPVSYFTQPRSCWLHHYYYRPTQDRSAAFLGHQRHSPVAREIVATEQHEIDGTVDAS